MTSKRVFIGAWLVGAAASAVVSMQMATAIWEPGPIDLLRLVLFWPLLVLESAGESTCAHGCSESLLYGAAQLIEWVFPISFLDTLSFLIPCVIVAWLIVRRLRPKRRRMCR